jgi:hypothetical protein
MEELLRQILAELVKINNNLESRTVDSGTGLKRSNRPVPSGAIPGSGGFGGPKGGST